MKDLLRNCLGGLEPVAHLGMMGNSVMLYTIASNMMFPKFSSIDAAEAYLVASGWDVIERKKDLSGKPAMVLRHIETHGAYQQAIAAQDEKWRDGKAVFVRYGKIPKGGRSRNHVDGTWEDGVSVYRAQMNTFGEVRIVANSPAQYVGALQFLADKFQLYLVDGKEIGVGSDGEPLLSGAKIIRKLAA